MVRVSKEEKQEMLFDVSEYDVKPSDKNEGVDNMDNKNFFEVGKAGKGVGSRITNETHQGATKAELFVSWAEELGMDKALLLSHNYPVKRVVDMSEEEAESECQALGYGI